jgi:hypothetical protein
MGAGVIHYFGIDPAETRQAIMRQAGYTVHYCDQSLDELIAVLQQAAPSATVLSELPEQIAEQVAEVVHAHSFAAVVLFRGEQYARNPRLYDCVVAPLTPPEKWLDMLADVIAIASAQRMKTETLRAESRMLRVTATELRHDAAELRSEAHRQKDNAQEMIRRAEEVRESDK